MTTTIRKVLIPEFGDESKVTIVTAELPAPAPTEVQVRIMYSGFAGADINMRRGTYPLQKKAPLTPGYCFVGHVVTSGAASSGFKQGDLVCALTVYDSEATHINVPAKYVVPVPAGMEPKKVAPLLLDWNTAYAMVMDSAKVSAGQKVFIHGLSGAVGWAVGILSTLQGAMVYGTASPRNHSTILAGLPNATVFDYSNKKWIQAMKDVGGVDAVFDALAFESWDESYSILNSKGRLLGYGTNLPALTGGPERSAIPTTLKLLSKNLKFWSGKRTTMYYITRDQSTFVPNLKSLFELTMSGKIDVVVKQIFKLDDVRQAHLTWSKQSGTGSIIIDCA
ncbi:hypothetical protein BP6252_11052 [Coleophoma cylindrospora]|uniref:Enoyl reductase (ER) domain-containing protein n=1 Tax=Coleophoma cylindrospora TaxID=1849047 RepID=A0A3D8QNZ3_9HELO|nr:hypothetical protein BP6252_11052 [Coleophoma cylindrospora]